MGKDKLKDLKSGINKFSKHNGEIMNAMMSLSKKASQSGELSGKTKKLMFVALAIQQHCSYCIAHHVHEAMSAGATAEEIYEAAEVAIAMGGGPSFAYTVTEVQNAVESFSNN